MEENIYKNKRKKKKQKCYFKYIEIVLNTFNDILQT